MGVRKTLVSSPLSIWPRGAGEAAVVKSDSCSKAGSLGRVSGGVPSELEDFGTSRDVQQALMIIAIPLRVQRGHTDGKAADPKTIGALGR